MVVVLAHWAEHLVQAWQIYVMGWPRPQANGVLGLWYPWLIKSEILHYSYALVMLVVLILIVWIAIDYRRQKERLRDLEASGVVRRSGRSAVDIG